jgi:hypothetical protein
MKELVGFSCVAAILALACGGSEHRAPGADSGPGPDGAAGEHEPERGALPMLPPGDHLTMMISFEQLPIGTAAEAEAKWQAAIDAGMRTARIQLTWRELEGDRGSYNRRRLRDQLEAAQDAGLVPFVGIYAIDSAGPEVPADLADDGSPTGLAGGVGMDDPAIVARYRELLDWAVPMIVEHGGWALAIGNEPEGYIEDFDQAEASTAFFGQAIEHAHSLDPQLAMTVTLTSYILDEEQPFFDGIMGLTDVASYNYYCLELTDRFVLRGPVEDRVPADLAELVARAGDRQVVLHELGCPAGWGDESVIGTSPEIQAQFFEVAFETIRATPELRVAVVFQLVDWSEELVELVFGAMLDEGLPEAFIDSFREWLDTSGLITYDDASERPAWDVFLRAVEQIHD